MSTLNPRQQFICNLARERGFVMIDALAAELSVTTQTIRRDLNVLCDQGMLSRFHGGAAYRSSVENMAYEARLGTLSAEKEQIARIVASRIPDDSSVFIDIGTTCEAVSRALLEKRGLRVVTNNLHVISALAGKSDIELAIAGGDVRQRDLAVVGAAATSFISKFEVDVSILGVVGISESGDILDFSANEEFLTQAIISIGRKTIIVADHTKFGRPALAKVAHIRQVDSIISDSSLSLEWRARIRQHNVEVAVEN